MNLRTFFQSRLTRAAVGLALVLHGLAHVALGTAVQDTRRGAELVVGTVLFLLATPGFVAAGLGAWSVPGLRAIWGGLVKASVLASVLLLVMAAPSGARATVAIVLDALLLAVADAMTVEPGAWRATS